MTQQPLILHSPTERKPRPRGPIASTADPITSHESAERLTESGERDAQAEMVLGMVRTHPGLTSAELAKQYGVDRYMVARRLPDLRADGFVRNGSMPRRCRVGKGSAVSWWPVEAKEEAA